METNEEQTEQEILADPSPQDETESMEMPSMADLLSEEDLNLELPRPGESKTGFIVRKTEDEILVSIGAKSEGVIPSRELSQIPAEELEALQVGDEVKVVVVTLEDSHGNLVLSYMRAKEEADWDEAERLLKEAELYESAISGYNKGGLIVKLGQLRGFVPASQVSLSRRMAYGGSTPDQRWGKMVGQPMIVKVLEVDRERQRLIFSELAVLQESREIFKERLLKEISVGDELDGRVTSLADFGAFVNINGADGLVHLTEISWDRIKHPSECLKVGQSVRVRVISIDEVRKRIGLSIRQLLADPWPEKVAHLREGQLIQARIVRLVKFGAFARLEGTDIEGLVHISELSDQRVEHPKEVLNEGDEVTLRIVRIEPEKHRIGLSLRKVHSPAYAELDLEMARAEAARAIEAPVEEADTAAEEASEETSGESAEEEAAPEAAEETAVAEAAVETESEVEAPAASDEEDEPAPEAAVEAESEAEAPAVSVEDKEEKKEEAGEADAPSAEAEPDAPEAETDAEVAAEAENAGEEETSEVAAGE